MEIYIDNKKIELGKKNKKNFERILKVITKKLEQNEKIIKSIYINGNMIEEDTVIDLSKLSVIEVETKSYVDLIVESLANCKNHIDTLLEILCFIDFKLENGNIVVREEIDEIHSFLTWFTDLIYLIEEVYGFENENYFIESVECLQNNAQLLNEKRKRKNYLDYINILKENIIENLENFYNNIDYYYEKILQEEKKKKLIV